MSNISIGELILIADTDHTRCGDASAMARELLEYRKASKEPVAYIGVNMLNDMRDGYRQSGRVWINDIGSGDCIPLWPAPQPDKCHK